MTPLDALAYLGLAAFVVGYFGCGVVAAKWLRAAAVAESAAAEREGVAFRVLMLVGLVVCLALGPIAALALIVTGDFKAGRRSW